MPPHSPELDKAGAEIELPPFLEISRDVTADSRYPNKQIASRKHPVG